MQQIKTCAHFHQFEQDTKIIIIEIFSVFSFSLHESYRIKYIEQQQHSSRTTRYIYSMLPCVYCVICIKSASTAVLLPFCILQRTTEKKGRYFLVYKYMYVLCVISSNNYAFTLHFLFCCCFFLYLFLLLLLLLLYIRCVHNPSLFFTSI